MLKLIVYCGGMIANCCHIGHVHITVIMFGLFLPMSNAPKSQAAHREYSPYSRHPMSLTSARVCRGARTFVNSRNPCRPQVHGTIESFKGSNMMFV